MQKIKLTCMCVYSSLSDIFFPPNQLNCKTTSGEVFWSCSNSQITDSYGSFHRFDSTASVNLDFDFGRYVVSNRLSLLRPQSIPQFIIHDEMTWWVYMTRGGGGGGRGLMNSSIAPIGIARRMILAIVTSREIYPGNFKWIHRAKLFRGFKR